MIYKRLDPKDPADVLNPVTFDFGVLVPNGATLTGAPIVTATPNDLVIGPAVAVNTQALFQVAGGRAGTTYTIGCLVSDTAGNTWHRSTTLVVQGL